MMARSLILGLFCALCIGIPAHALPREEGAVYLEDVLEKPLRLAVLADISIFYDKTLGRYLGTLRRGQTVEVQAVSDDAYRVRGRAQQGQVAGWVEPSGLTPLNKDFLKNLQQASDRKAQVDALIAANEVAIHMTGNEVIASLGKPQKKSSRLDEKGRSEIWEYVRYERVPRQVTGYDKFGRAYNEIVYVKVPAGRLAVILENGLVSALEQSEGSLRDARAKIVAEPFVVH